MIFVPIRVMRHGMAGGGLWYLYNEGASWECYTYITDKDLKDAAIRMIETSVFRRTRDYIHFMAS